MIVYMFLLTLLLNFLNVLEVVILWHLIFFFFLLLVCIEGYLICWQWIFYVLNFESFIALFLRV
jgi:hypothetical protein